MKWLRALLQRIKDYDWPDPAIHRQAPDTLFLLFFVVISGILQLITSVTAPAVTDQVGQIITTFWAGGLILFGGAALVGCVWPDRDDGLLIERAGRVTLFTFSLIYSVLVVLKNGEKAILPACLTMAFALACLVRVVHISIWVQKAGQDAD